MVLEAHALYSEGTKMTCCSFLAVSDQSYNCISYFFLFFRLSYFVLKRPGNLLISCLSPAIPIITFYLQLLKKSIQRNRICYSSSAHCSLFRPHLVLKSKFCAFEQFRLSSLISSPATLPLESFLSSRECSSVCHI